MDPLLMINVGLALVEGVIRLQENSNMPVDQALLDQRTELRRAKAAEAQRRADEIAAGQTTPPGGG